MNHGSMAMIMRPKLNLLKGRRPKNKDECVKIEAMRSVLFYFEGVLIMRSAWKLSRNSESEQT